MIFDKQTWEHLAVAALSERGLGQRVQQHNDAPMVNGGEIKRLEGGSWMDRWMCISLRKMYSMSSIDIVYALYVCEQYMLGLVYKCVCMYMHDRAHLLLWVFRSPALRGL